MTPPRRVVAAMQPYLFPYLGYFQLIHHADLFVLADDFPWVDRGWINRNRILDQGRVVYFTFATDRRREPDLISHVQVTSAYPRERATLLRRLRHAYARAANREAIDLIESWLPLERTSVLEITSHLLEEVCGYLDLDTPRHSSSERPTAGRGTTRAVALAEAWGATEFLNPPGGRTLYRAAEFADRGMGLSFLEPALEEYPQVGAADFVPALSVLDVILNVDRDRACALARAGRAVPATD